MEWQEQFRKDWKVAYGYRSNDWIEYKIQSLLDQQKKALLKKIKLVKTGNKDTYKEPGHCRQCDFIDGYNQAVSDLEELKKTM